MADEALAVLEPEKIEAVKPVELPPPTVHLVARNPQQMAAAQADLTSWLQGKRDSLLADVHEMELARDEAKKHKWKTSSFNSAILKFRKQHDFYQKLLEATKAGYTIIPNLPIDLIAVKVMDKDFGPSDMERQEGWNQSIPINVVAEKADQSLSAGQGDYVSPDPNVVRRKYTEDINGKRETRYSLRATSLKDMEFPVAVAVPQVMDATAEAMALKIFDQIGICPAKGLRASTWRKTQLPPSRDPDPLIVGQVLSPKQGYSGGRPVSFLIAWHLDLRTL